MLERRQQAAEALLGVVQQGIKQLRFAQRVQRLGIGRGRRRRRGAGRLLAAGRVLDGGTRHGVVLLGKGVMVWGEEEKKDQERSCRVSALRQGRGLVWSHRGKPGNDGRGAAGTEGQKVTASFPWLFVRTCPASFRPGQQADRPPNYRCRRESSRTGRIGAAD